jgi:hypothetical protein
MTSFKLGNFDGDGSGAIIVDIYYCGAGIIGGKVSCS